MLANGESFTKLDLARAYKQMKVQKECQPLLTIKHASWTVSIYKTSLWHNDSSIFMAEVLNGLSGVVCYIGDISGYRAYQRGTHSKFAGSPNGNM